MLESHYVGNILGFAEFSGCRDSFRFLCRAAIVNQDVCPGPCERQRRRLANPYPRSQSVRGEAPAITNTWPISCTDSLPFARFSQVTRFKCTAISDGRPYCDQVKRSHSNTQADFKDLVI